MLFLTDSIAKLIRLVIRTMWVAAVLLPMSAMSADDIPINKGRNSNVAINGIDTVSYRLTTQAFGPSRGDARYEVQHAGAVWRFASKESSERFAANPDAFTPAYGGYCANALALGEGLIPTGGQHWEIFEDQLYLFFAGRGRDRWLDGNWKQYKGDADAAWAELK